MKRIHRSAITVGLLLSMAAAVVAQQIAGAPSVSSYTEWIESPITTGVKPGATVALNGGNFGAEQGRVEIDCLDATITSWTSTRITCIVPTHPPTQQPVSVTVYCVNPPTYYRDRGFRIIQ